jgi:hypothetical protein
VSEDANTAPASSDINSRRLIRSPSHAARERRGGNNNNVDLHPKSSHVITGPNATATTTNTAARQSTTFLVLMLILSSDGGLDGPQPPQAHGPSDHARKHARHLWGGSKFFLNGEESGAAGLKTRCPIRLLCAFDAIRLTPQRGIDEAANRRRSLRPPADSPDIPLQNDSDLTQGPPRDSGG